MVLTKIFFFILLIICVVFYVLYVWDFSLVLLIVIASVPIIMLAMLLYAKKKISVEFAVKDKTVSKNETFPVQLCISNSSFVPIGKAEAVIEYCNTLSPQYSSIEFHFPIQQRNSQRVTFQLSSKFCGILKIRSAYINIYDPLRIFRMRVGKNISETIAVFPESHDISGTVNKAIRLNEESSVYSEHCPGDDPSEVFDLRDYCMGDKLNRIHWKLSSKKDQFIVKDYSLPVDSPAALLLDLRFGENSEYTLPVFDTLIEVFVSLSQLMLENECFHSIIYCDSRKKRFEEKSITNLDSLASAVNDIIFSLANVSEALPPELYFDDEHIRELSSFTYITAEKNEKILSFIDENIDADSKNAIIIVKSTEETDLACGDAGSVEITPVVIGRISSSVKDIEL